MQLRHRQVSWVLGFSLTVVAAPINCLALSVQEVPNPRQANGGSVTDMADILSPATETQLNQLVAELQAKKGAELAIVTVARTTPEHSPREFATELFNYWGIGKKGQDNGVLLLISKGDRRVEIETGYGVEAILPDAKVGRILSEEITPQFKQGNFDGGTLAGTKTLVATLATEITTADLRPTSTQPSTETLASSGASDSEDSPWYVWWIGGLGVVGGLIAISWWLDTINNSYDSSNYSQSDRPLPRSETYLVSDQQTNSASLNHYNSASRSSDSSSDDGGYSFSGRPPSSSYSSDNSYSSSSSSDISSSNDTSSSYSSDNSYSSSSSSDTSSSYGSSDYGGGTSGGGGAGDSW